MNLTPAYTASAVLAFAAGGSLALGSVPGGVSVQLALFFKGEKGDKGDTGDKGDKGESGDSLMYWTSSNW